jgi:hypothetical protein
MRVTDAVSLAVPSWTEPKSTTVGIADDVGPLAATLNAEAGAAVSPPAHAKAATAKSTDTSLRFWWGLAAGVTDEQWRANHRDVPPFGWFGVTSIEWFFAAQKGAHQAATSHSSSASQDRTLVCVPRRCECIIANSVVATALRRDRISPRPPRTHASG